MKPSRSHLLLLFLIVVLNRAHAEEYKLLDFHGRSVVLKEGTASADGQYALAWTVDAKKGSAPVDWSKMKTDWQDFRSTYLTEYEGDYSVADLVVDLQARTVVGDLGYKDWWFPTKNRGGLEATWGPPQQGRRFGLVMNDGRDGSDSVDLIEVGPVDPISFRRASIQPVLDRAVQAWIARQTKHSATKYLMAYYLFGLPELGTLTGFADATTVRIPFSADVPKSENSPSYRGVVTVKLSRAGAHPTATVADIRNPIYQGDIRETDFLDDPRNQRADAALNTIYTTLRKTLPAEAREKLLTEQREWLKARDAKAKELGESEAPADPPVSRRILRDRALGQMTQVRTEELQALVPKPALPRP